MYAPSHHRCSAEEEEAGSACVLGLVWLSTPAPQRKGLPVLTKRRDNLLPLPVVSDEGVQRVRMGQPLNQPRVLGQRDHRVPTDTAGEKYIAQHYSIIA